MERLGPPHIPTQEKGPPTLQETCAIPILAEVHSFIKSEMGNVCFAIKRCREIILAPLLRLTDEALGNMENVPRVESVEISAE